MPARTSEDLVRADDAVHLDVLASLPVEDGVACRGVIDAADGQHRREGICARL
jgi:hypothetical protein